MMPDREAVRAAVSDARHRWERYVADCNPVEELDEHGRTLDQAIADRVLALSEDTEPPPLQDCGTYHADDDECDECSEHHCSNPIQCQYCTERRAEDDYESSRHDG